jgi:hypothetical protein
MVFVGILNLSDQLGGDDLSGKTKLKVEPLPTSLSTQIFPPCSSTNFLAKVNPSPVPLDLMRIVGPHLAEFLEYSCLIIGRDPDPGVTDRDFHRIIGLPGFNSNPSSLRGELHCLGKYTRRRLS